MANCLRRCFGWVWVGCVCLTNCRQTESETKTVRVDRIAACHTPPPARWHHSSAGKRPTGMVSGNRAGMVHIPGGAFLMGADDEQARPNERPKHQISVDDFWMDATEVTNTQFTAFVRATAYITTAEQKPDWAELQKQLPPGTPKPADSLLVAGALVFSPPGQAVSPAGYGQWWQWTAGANWRHPTGPGSTIAGKERHPVVQVSWEDAAAYAAWAGKRLPTEAEWEWASRGGLPDKLYPWGNEPVDVGRPKANTWQGGFPDQNTRRDGFYGTGPVKSFAANGYGLYDMVGNVWEWCADFYRADYYRTLAQTGRAINPAGPPQSYDPQEPTIPKRVQRGGSFLCNDSCCSSYRTSARMKSSPDTGLAHTGFRCVQQ